MHKLPVRGLGIDPHERLSGQIGAGHGFPLGKRMIAMDQKHIRFGKDLADVQIPVFGSDDRNPELDLPRLHQLVNPAHWLIMELHGDIGPLLAKLPQDRRKIVIGDGWQAGERQAVLLGVAAFAQTIIRLGKMRKISAHLWKQRLSLLCQQNVARAADQQLHAKIGLDFSDAVTERGLRQIEIVPRAVTLPSSAIATNASSPR